MFLLSPAKLLVILVVALVVLGPDKLPKVAKQLGSLWADIRRYREKLESEVRSSFPDLPSADTFTQAVRSPLTLLESLADNNADNEAARPHDAAGVRLDAQCQTEPETQWNASSDCTESDVHKPIELEDLVDSRGHGSHPFDVAHQIRPDAVPEVGSSELY
jgi:sec-independent protein translocase protein TatB